MNIRLNHLFLLLLLTLFTATPATARKKKQPERPTRIACVGNSVTYGYGLRNRDRDAYPVRLQEMLDASAGSGKYEVRNFGHSGSTLLYKGHRPYVGLPEFRQAMDFQADWVVIHLGLNDTDPRNWPDWKEEFIPNYRALIDSFLVANPKARVLVCLMTPIFDRHPRFQSGTRDWHAQIQEAIRQVASGAQVQLVDLYSPLHSRPDLFPDALHPNPEGAQILATTVFGALTGSHGGLQLPVVFGNGMVCQREKPLVLNGKADARQQIVVSLKQNGHVVKETGTFSRADGSWKAEMGSWKAGGPYTMTVTAKPLRAKDELQNYPPQYPVALKSLTGHATETITIDSLFFGDVWLASGQSNMELRVDQCNTIEADLADARRVRQRLHLFNMPARARTDAIEWPDSVLTFTNRLEHMDIQGWSTATDQAVLRFSAVGFNFGRVLCDSLSDVPIGIICNAVGGSTTESWVSRTTLEREFPDIISNWRNADFGQAWARGRMTKNIARALDKQSPVYNPLQRHPYEPCYLFEAAIQPLAHFPLKGVIWYQGESNANNIELHERLFGLLQQSFRQEFAGGPAAGATSELPFYAVQLSSLPRPSWPAFRDSQRRLFASLPQTWMAVTTDLGEANDVHYRTKRPVGERLALQALNHTYGHNLVSEGPVPAAVSCRFAEPPAQSTVTIRFKNADGLTATKGFELAGPDGIFHPATIVVEGDVIRLSSAEVSKPEAVRYGWSGFTDADLRNAQGLPASTFRCSIEE
ncbi:MAG: sialate O-acetylesterase [Bacteroidaceae bacterium]|nr:sialate O-acetylesterase [Bacteroidaceae bacterium]